MAQLPSKVMPFVLFFAKEHLALFIGVLLSSLVWSIDQTVWPYIFKELIDSLLTFEGDKKEIWYYLMPILIAWASLWIGIEIGFRLQGILSAFLFPRTEASIRTKMFDYVQGHSHNYFANHFAGSIANKINDATRSFTYVIQQTLRLFIPVCVAIIIAISMFASVHPLFATLLFMWVCMHIGVCIYFADRCSELSDAHSDCRSTLTGRMVDVFTNIVNVKLFARKRHEYKQLNQYQDDEQQKHFAALFMIEKIRIILGILSFIFPGVFITWFMIYSWQHDLITIGELVLIFQITWNIMLMVWITGSELPIFFKEIGVLRQGLSVIEAKHEIQNVTGANTLHVVEGKIEFQHVHFHYHDGNAVFRDKSLVIEPGTKVGLVGFSGSGKTTFVNLLTRFFDIKGGQILIDEQNIHNVTIDSLREQIAFIPQDPTLFHRSLMDNIRYGNLAASDKDVMEAARKAHCHEFIDVLPEKYNTLVGERGIKLSGGQRQRIAIARAMLKNVPILILDEATSALDSVTEELIQRSMKELMEHKTAIIIAHRLATVASMDRILVFDKGIIVEDGNHNTLLKQKGHYARMWHMQAGGFLPDHDLNTDTKEK